MILLLVILLHQVVLNATVNSADKNGTADGTNRVLDGGTTLSDSVGIIGQVSLTSHKAFTVTPGDSY